MKKTLMIFLLLVAIQHRATLHPINMTVTDISFKDKKICMKIKFFADDFQAALSQAMKVPVDLVNQPLSKSEGHIKKYISARLNVLVDKAPVKWSYKKSWLSNDVMYVEYEAVLKAPETIKSLEVKDVLMFDDFPEQKNIVNVTLNGDLQVLTYDNGSDDTLKKIDF